MYDVCPERIIVPGPGVAAEFASLVQLEEATCLALTQVMTTCSAPCLCLSICMGMLRFEDPGVDHNFREAKRSCSS